MIKSREEHGLFMDFSNIKSHHEHPSDIDMYFDGENYQIFGEIKNYKGTFKDAQRRRYEHLVNECTSNAIALYITHMEDVHKGSRSVDVAECYVCQYYLKGYKSWIKPKRPIKVKEAFRKLEGD